MLQEKKEIVSDEIKLEISDITSLVALMMNSPEEKSEEKKHEKLGDILVTPEKKNEKL